MNDRPLAIPISGQRGQGMVAFVSPSDVQIASRKWHVGTDGYARRKATEAEVSAGAPKNISMHREVLGLHLEKGRCGDDVDHIDGNRLNNCRDNLRRVSRSQNNLNRHRSCGQSRFTGVSFFKPAKLWRAYVTKDGKRKDIGYFKTELEAAAARDAFCVENLPDARLNKDRRYA